MGTLSGIGFGLIAVSMLVGLTGRTPPLRDYFERPAWVMRQNARWHRKALWSHGLLAVAYVLLAVDIGWPWGLIVIAVGMPLIGYQVRLQLRRVRYYERRADEVEPGRPFPEHLQDLEYALFPRLRRRGHP